MQQRIKVLEREVRDLWEANEILKAASIFFARKLDPRHRSSAGFIDQMRARGFRVEVGTTGQDLDVPACRSRCSRWRRGQGSDRRVVLFARVALLGNKFGNKTLRNRPKSVRQAQPAEKRHPR